jgi:cytochrome c biogenesis protein CcdA
MNLGLVALAGVISFISPRCLPVVPMHRSVLAGIMGRSSVMTVFGALALYKAVKPSHG